jgi:hypothetical protein
MSGGPCSNLASPSNIYYDDTTAGSGTTYYYVVRPADATNIEQCQSSQISATASPCVLEFPSAFLPATMIIGFLGAVLLIRRTREQ